MMRYLALSLVTALLFAACGDSSPSTSTPVPTGTPVPTASLEPSSLGQLAFIRDGNLLAIDLDRGRETLVAEAGVAHNPKFSHDGRLVAYAEGSFVGGAGAGLFIVPPDGKGQPLPVDRPVSFWEWSPVQPLLAYQLASDNSVWTYDSRNVEKKQVLAPHQRRTPFVWSPDGRYLAYGIAEYTAGDPPVFGPSGVEVYDLEMRTARQLVTRNDGAIPHVQSWSPDGSRLAYWLSNISASINADGADFWWADLKGGATGPIGTTLMYNEAAVWKHTGDSSALAVSEGGGRETWDGKDLHLVRPHPPFPAQPLDVRVAASGFSEVEPSWQPRGTSLAFVRIPEPKDASVGAHVDSLKAAHIWAVDDTGARETQLTDDPAYADRLPHFSADGRHILFLRLRTGNWSEDAVPAEMWLMDADGSNARKVADLGVVGWFGYYGRIDPEALFDWYLPDATPGAAFPAASGDPPGSDEPLPEGVSNGDIVDSGGLLWFVWKNTRSRIWMPYAGPDGYLDTLADGPEATGWLVGAVESESASQVLVRTSADFSRVEQVYILDEASGSKRQVRHVSVGWQGFRQIPTAFNPQYYPVLRIE